MRRRNAGQPRAWQVPKMDTAEAEVKAIDEAYTFGFEWFGSDRGVQRLIHRTDDTIDDYLADQRGLLVQSDPTTTASPRRWKLPSTSSG